MMRTLVPAVATLALAAAAPALEITGAPGLTINGWGEAYVFAGQRDDFNPRTTSAGRDEGYVDFPSQAALILGYAHEDFTLRVDTIIASQNQFDDDNVLLEQCFIDWRAAPAMTVRAGRFQNTWLGWEGFHTPELWRVQHSAAWDWNVQNHGVTTPARPFVSDGVAAMFAVPDTGWTLIAVVGDDILGGVTGEKPSNIGVGGSAAYRVSGVGRFEIGAAVDPNSTLTREGTGQTAWGVDVNADITALRDQGWFFAAEAQYHRHPRLWVAGETWGNDLVLLAMANYRFHPQMSVTAMVDYVERGYSADDNEVLEVALALLTKPRRQVLLNAEVFYWDERADDADAFGAAAVLNVLLP